MTSAVTDLESSWLSILERHARTRGERTAIACRSQDGRITTTSYAALLHRVRSLATLFEQQTPEGAIIPLCCSRGPDAVAAVLAALVSGRVFCCVNPKLRVPQLERIVMATQANFALIDESGLLAMRGELEASSPLFTPNWWLSATAPLTRLALKPFQRFSERNSIRELPVDGPVPLYLEPELPPSRPGACLFTSGSTGVPKGVLVSVQDLMARADAEVSWFGLSESDVLLNILPFSFDVGLNQMLSAVMVGAELVVLESWLPRDILSACAQQNVTGISGVPSIWADFLRDGLRFDRSREHAALRYITVSGGDLTRAQQARLPDVAQGARIFKTYGQTEAFRATSLRPEDYARKVGSVGQAFHGVELYVVREDGSLAAPNELGEVVHGGLGVMLGYLDGQDPERKLRRNPWRTDAPSANVIFTGDIGFLDEEGFLYLSGRRDDLVKIQGNRVYPSEVQNHIASMAGVSSVEVIVVRTETRTELAAFVVLSTDMPPGTFVDAKSLRAHLTRMVPSYMVPELFFVREALPRTTTGKPDRVTLAKEAAEHLAGARCA